MKCKKNLRKIHLKQRIAEMTMLGSEDFRIRVAHTIKQIEQQGSTHSSIHSILKPRNIQMQRTWNASASQLNLTMTASTHLEDH